MRWCERLRSVDGTQLLEPSTQHLSRLNGATMPANAAQIDLYFTYRVHDEDLFAEYLDAVLPVTAEQEPYVLEYTLARGVYGTILQHERYENEAAIGRHLELTREGQEKWGQSTELLDIRFVGPLSQEFRDAYNLDVGSWWDRYKAASRG